MLSKTNSGEIKIYIKIKFLLIIKHIDITYLRIYQNIFIINYILHRNDLL